MTTVAKTYFVSIAALSLTIGCGKPAAESKRSDDGKSEVVANDSTAFQGYAIEGNGMSFDLLLPEAAETDSSSALLESQVAAEEVVAPIGTAHVKIDCKPGDKRYLKRETQFSISLTSNVGDAQTVETATAFNCGRAVQIKISGLEADIGYKLAASLVIKDLAAFSAESAVFTLDSKYIKLIMARAELPKWKDIKVDVVFKDVPEGGMDGGDDDVICPANFSPTVCWAKIAQDIQCIKAPCPTTKKVMAKGENQCRAMDHLTKKVMALGGKVDEADVQCAGIAEDDEEGEDQKPMPVAKDPILEYPAD